MTSHESEMSNTPIQFSSTFPLNFNDIKKTSFLNGKLFQEMERANADMTKLLSLSYPTIFPFFIQHRHFCHIHTHASADHTTRLGDPAGHPAASSTTRSQSYSRCFVSNRAKARQVFCYSHLHRQQANVFRLFAISFISSISDELFHFFLCKS